MQSAPQSRPAGALVTVPEPLFVTDSLTEGRVLLNVAVTEVAALTVTTQVPVPEQGALQPAKVELVAAVAVRVMVVPGVTDREHVAPQLMPAGALVTVPTPEPFLLTESVTGPVVGRAGTVRPAHDASALVCPAALTDRMQTKPVLAAPLAWYGRFSWNDRPVTVPCWAALPSLKAAA